MPKHNAKQNKLNFSIEKTNPIFQEEDFYNIDNEIIFNSVSIDSRTIKDGDLFLAIKGPNFDGNNFAENAAQKNASVLVVNKKMNLDIPTIVTKNSLTFLEKLAKYNREINHGKFISVTGSFGKTSTKELLQTTLSAQYHTYCTKKNMNNYIGIPLTIANSPRKTECSIIEIGISGPNEMQHKASLTQPDIAVITSTGLMHAENFTTPYEIAENKSMLLDHINSDSVQAAIICSTGSLSHHIINKAKHHINVKQLIVYGLSERDDIQILKTQIIGPQEMLIKVRIFNELYDYRIPTLSNAIAINSLATIAMSYVMNINLQTVFTALLKFQSIEGRGKLIPTIIQDKKLYILDDSYNAGPESIINGIQTLHNAAANNGGRKILVLGAIKELGKFKIEVYDSIIPHLKNLSLVITTEADITKHISQYIKCQTVNSVQELTTLLIKTTQNNDNILFKGSRSAQIERAISLLLKTAKNAN